MQEHFAREHFAAQRLLFSNTLVTGMIHAPMIHEITAAAINKFLPENVETSSADRNCPKNIAIVHRLIFVPFFPGALFLTTRLLNNGVDSPNPAPANNTAVHSAAVCPERK